MSNMPDLDNDIRVKIDPRWKCPNAFSREDDIGRFVFFIEDRNVHIGIVEDVYLTEVCVVPLAFADGTTVNGTPKALFETPTKWQKLPKEWTNYCNDGGILQLGFRFPAGLSSSDFSKMDLESIKRMYELGGLVVESQNDSSRIEVEYGSNENKGKYRIRRNWNNCKHNRSYVSLTYDKLYRSYEEAKEVINHELAERQRIANMSDYEFAVYEIDSCLNRLKLYLHVSDEKCSEYRDRLLQMENVEDLEVRVFAGGIEYKYQKNKKWIKLID